MTTNLSKELEAYLNDFHVKATAWFIEEIGKISKEYNIYLSEFGKLQIQDIDGEEWYDGGVSGEGQHELWKEVDDKIFELSQHMEYDLKYKFQFWVYNSENKEIH